MTPKGFMYNPYEIALCDPLGLSEGALTDALARKLSEEFDLGVVIEDRDPSERRTPHPAARLTNGAGESFLSCPRSEYGAHIIQPLIELDFVLVEDSEDSVRPKIVLVGEGEVPVMGNVIAYVSTSPIPPSPPENKECIPAADLDAIGRCVVEHLQGEASRMPLQGLVLAGGESSRMSQEKPALQYHDKPQVRYCFDLLSEICAETYVSLHPEQADSLPVEGLPIIEDRFVGFGPMGGILSAFTKAPDAAWCVVACDMPFLNRDTLARLRAGRNPFRAATAFQSSNGRPEPLCTIYEPKSVFSLHRSMAQGSYKLNTVLADARAHLLEPHEGDDLTNVNTDAEHEAVLDRIVAERGDTR